jgi:hypothetical protein
MENTKTQLHVLDPAVYNGNCEKCSVASPVLHFTPCNFFLWGHAERQKVSQQSTHSRRTEEKY